MASGSPFDHITDVPDDIAGELPPTSVIPTQNYDQSSWNRRPQFCRLVWTAFEDPGSSWVAAILGVGITLLIILALTAFVLETLPEYHGRDLSPFPEIELFCTVVFCMEYTIRLACCPKFLAFLRDPWNLADFLAVLPLFVEKGIGEGKGKGAADSMAMLRVVRLTRIMKLVRSGRRNKNMAGMLLVFHDTIKKSWESMKLMLLFELMTMVVCGSIVYSIEKGTWDQNTERWYNDQGEESKFQNVFSAMYWTLVTVTGVGYGDMVPLSVLGKLATFVTILAGLLLIALPVSIIGGNFASVYMEFNRREIKERYRAVGAAAAFAIGGVRHRIKSHTKAIEEARATFSENDFELSRTSSRMALDPDVIMTHVPANDVCASVYMEHLLRGVRNVDEHMIESIDMMVADQFCHIMKHVHKFSLEEEDRVEATEWDEAQWKDTGVGMPLDVEVSLGRDIMMTIRALNAAARAKARLKERRFKKRTASSAAPVNPDTDETTTCGPQEW